ncbi:hypothetical protein LXL04_009297 [Taraxacum kok-saghyz]
MATGLELFMAKKICSATHAKVGCEYYGCNGLCVRKHGYTAVGNCLSFYLCGCQWMCWAKDKNVRNPNVSSHPKSIQSPTPPPNT